MSNLSLFRPAGDLDPPLPERVPCLSLWQPYADLVVAGIKTIETRTWPWPYAPGWLAIHQAQGTDREAMSRLAVEIARAQGRRDPNGSESRRDQGEGRVLGLVHVTGSRPLLPADETAACFYAPDRYAWPLEKALRFKEPIVMRGPQKFVYLPRERVLEALRGTA